MKKALATYLLKNEFVFLSIGVAQARAMFPLAIRQPYAYHHTGHHQLHQAITHNICCLKPCNRQHRQCPEGLQQISPSTPPCHCHSHTRNVDPKRFSTGNHHWALYRPLPPTRWEDRKSVV